MELSKDEQRSRDFADLLSGWFWELDEAGRFTFMSGRFFKITGDSPGSLTGKSFDASGFAMQDPADKSAFEQACRERRPFTDLVSTRTLSDGRRYWIRSSGVPVFDDDGQYIGHRGASTDVTALMEAERELQQTAARLNDFAEASADFYWETDADLRYAYLSPVAERSIGLDLAASLGRTPREVIGPDYDLQDSLKHVDECLRTRKPFRNVEFWRRHASDGETIWIRTSGMPFLDADGNFAGFRGSSTVITERRRAEESSRESERQFQLLAANIAGGLLYMTPEGRYQFVNRVYASWFGLEPEDFVGRSAKEVLGEDVEAQVRQYLLAAAKGETVTYEATRETVELGTRDVQVTNVPSITADGTVEGVFALVTDVTDLKSRERALAKSEQNLAEAQRIGQIGHWRFLHGAGQSEWSDEMYRIWGLDADGATVNLEGILASIHPDDRQSVIDAREAAVSENKAYSLEFRIIRPDGEIRYIRNEGRPEFDAGGNLLSIFGISQDITERKQADEALRDGERNFRAIAEGSPVPLLITRQSDGTILYANPKVGPVLGHATEALIGKKIGPFFWRPGDRDARAARLKRDGLITDEALEMVRADGTRISTIHALQPINYDGEDAILGSFQDVTERLRLEDQLRQAQKMEAVGQLTGGVAHDFNNLLAVIMGNLELLLEQVEREGKASQLAMRALAATQRGADLTHRLLAFSRRQPLRPIPVDVNDLIGEMHNLLVRTLGEDIGIKLVGGDGLWRCEVDPGQLENAALNLSINARDAMPDGGLLTIETSNVRLDENYTSSQEDVAPGEYVLLSISDTGTGMEKDVIEQAFDPFFTTKEVGKGSGLGLSMIYGFVKQSGGHARIYSELGEGTTMKIYLPRFVASSDAAVASEIKSSTDAAARGEVVVVVEDDADVRAVTVAILLDLGYEVVEAANAADGLAQLERNKGANLLVADIVLPGGMGGRDLADKACALFPDLRVLYISGYAENALSHHGRLDDGVQLLVKPFRREDLGLKVREILDGARA